MEPAKATITWYCVNKCKNAAECKYRRENNSCVYEYQATGGKYDWQGEGPPPPKWVTDAGTIVYRSYSDYVD